VDLTQKTFVMDIFLATTSPSQRFHPVTTLPLGRWVTVSAPLPAVPINVCAPFQPIPHKG
jgi:hypothetical protein